MELHAVAEQAAAGASLRDIAMANPVAFIKHHAGIKEYMSVMSQIKPRSEMTKLHIYWGKAGTGKSRRMHWEADQLGDKYVLDLSKPSHVQWWKGYTGQVSIILDDYAGQLQIEEFLKMVDRHPYKVRVDQTQWREFTSSHVFITANRAWELIYASAFMHNKEHKAAFQRRIYECCEFPDDQVWQPPEDELQEPEIDEMPAPSRCDSPMSKYAYMQLYHSTHCQQQCTCEEHSFITYGNLPEE